MAFHIINRHSITKSFGFYISKRNATLPSTFLNFFDYIARDASYLTVNFLLWYEPDRFAIGKFVWWQRYLHPVYWVCPQAVPVNVQVIPPYGYGLLQLRYLSRVTVNMYVTFCPTNKSDQTVFFKLLATTVRIDISKHIFTWVQHCIVHVAFCLRMAIGSNGTLFSDQWPRY